MPSGRHCRSAHVVIGAHIHQSSEHHRKSAAIAQCVRGGSAALTLAPSEFHRHSLVRLGRQTSDATQALWHPQCTARQTAARVVGASAPLQAASCSGAYPSKLAGTRQLFPNGEWRSNRASTSAPCPIGSRTVPPLLRTEAMPKAQSQRRSRRQLVRAATPSPAVIAAEWVCAQRALHPLPVLSAPCRLSASASTRVAAATALLQARTCAGAIIAAHRAGAAADEWPTPCGMPRVIHYFTGLQALVHR